MRRGVLVALWVGLAPGLAAAQSRMTDSLAVLPIVVEGPSGRASTSQIYDAVARASRPRLGLRLISAEEMFVAQRGGLTARVQDCGPDVGCIAGKLRMFDARLGLVVVLNFAATPAIFSLQLVDTNTGRAVEERLGEVRAGEDPSARVTAEAERLLDAAGVVKSGRVVVEVEPSRAQVRVVDGPTPDTGTPNVFTLAPGRYTVAAELEDHDPTRAEVDVRPGETTTARLSLDAHATWWKSPWLWAAVGVVVAGGATAAVLATRPGDPTLCVSLDGRSSCP